MNLKEIKDDPVSLSNCYEKLEFIRLRENEITGVMQFIHKLIPRKYRTKLEEFKDDKLLMKIKDEYIASVNEWFGVNGKGRKTREPF